MTNRTTLLALGTAVLAGAALAVLPASATDVPHQHGMHTQATRDMYSWPYAWDSIWNLPLAKTAKYSPYRITTDNIYIDWEDISVNADDPVKTLDDNGNSVRVHADPNLEADGHWNNCATFLEDTSDKKTVIQGQPLNLDAGGDPSWQYPYGEGSLTGDGIRGCHGGSALSGLGGDIRGGELTGDAPIQHALKIGLSSDKDYSPEGGGYQWPATKADSGYEDNYQGDDPRVHMGTLFALPPDFDLSQITEPDVRKVAAAMKTYGAYIVDSTGGGGSNQIDVQHGYEDQLPNVDSDQMHTVFAALNIVTNSAKDTPGGGTIGAARLAQCAPAFADGTGGAPANCGAQ